MPIVVRTMMQHMPESCNKCGFYLPASQNDYGKASCRAVASFGMLGKPITAWWGKVHTTKHRAPFCPLREVEDIG